MSLKTDNFKLYKYEDNDIGDLRFINDSMDIIDKGINPFYVATQSSTNVYKVTTGLNKTVLNDGYSIKVAIPSNSTGAVSITVDSVTVPVKKPNGNAVTNFKQNGVYSLTYYNSVFILASGGGADTVNFTSDKLLTGYSANDSNGEKVNGTMPNKGTSTNTLPLNGSLTLPKGYYDSIKVTQSVTTKGSTTDAISQGHSGDYIYTRIPRGAYFTNASTGYPEIKSKFSDIAKTIGLTADKLVGTVGGITGTGKVFYNKTIDVTIPANATTFNVNIGFKPTTVILRILTPSGVQADNWIHARSTDITWFTHAWIEEKTSSSSSYTPTTQIDSLTNTGFVYRVQQSGGSYSTDKSYKFQIFAIG